MTIFCIILEWQFQSSPRIWLYVGLASSFVKTRLFGLWPNLDALSLLIVELKQAELGVPHSKIQVELD